MEAIVCLGTSSAKLLVVPTRWRPEMDGSLSLDCKISIRSHENSCVVIIKLLDTSPTELPTLKTNGTLIWKLQVKTP